MKGLYQSLVKFADLAGVVGKPHHGLTKFEWQLELNADGSLASPELIPLTSQRQVGRRVKELPYMEIYVPRTTRTRGVLPMLGADHIAYVLGWAQPPERAPDQSEAEWQEAKDKEQVTVHKKHRAWVDLMSSWAEFAEAQGDFVPHAVVSFLRGYKDQVQRPEKWTSKDGVYLRVDGRPVVEAPSAVAFWTKTVDSKKATGAEGLCLVCSEFRPLVDTFPTQIKGPLLPNGQSSGVAPVSVNEIAYGYGLTKGLGQVPVCMDCSLAIVAALNHLLDAEEHRSRTPDSATIWWIEEAEQHNPALILDEARPEDISSLLNSVQQAKPLTATLDLKEFHSLILQGNASRMIVRDWTHMPIRALQQNIADWFLDTEVQPLSLTGRSYQPLWLLAMCTGRFDAGSGKYFAITDSVGKHPHAVTETLREVALGGLPLPREIAAHLVQRIAADRRIDDPRVALLRLYLIRKDKKGRIMTGLDVSNGRPAYLLGRLLSVYEDTQYASSTLGGGEAPNATFADRYLAGAITSPRLVLTAGAKQSAAWLAKLRKSGRDYFAKKQIDEIISRLDPAEPGPIRASLDEQAEFVLGYHHQRAASQADRQKAIQDKKLADAIQNYSATQPTMQENDHDLS
ncbi:MAG: type I-C CRISPR-associated protein Cas8c/Csd1 [Brooklawnia sp.]|jgi:CRISPR-associated protein Csd1